MRHLTKRLLAGVLALALLSGLASASAIEAITYASGHATGGAMNQGTVTEGLVNIVLPSVQQDFFDFVLDPSNFIATTNAAAYNGVAYREGSVYFRSVTDDGEVLLSPDSHPLTIINKGVLPVEVDVSLTVDKGDYDFTFTDTPEFLDENGDAVQGNAMYLALASGRRTAPVKASVDNGRTVYSASLRNWIGPTENAHDVVWNNATQAYGYVAKDGLTDEDFQSVSFYVTGEINNSAWEETNSGISLAVVWDIYYAESGDSETPYTDPDIAPSVKVKTGTSDPGGEVTLRVDMGAGANLMTSIDKVTYLRSDGSLGTIHSFTVEPVNFYLNDVTFSAPSDLTDASNWRLSLSNGSDGSADVDFDPTEESVDPNASVTVLSKASEGGDAVTMEVYFGHGNTAYPIVQRLAYTASDGSESSFLALTTSNVTETGATVSLIASSALLSGSDWNLILANESGQTTALPVDIYNSDVVSREPSVEVVSKATVSGDTISLTLDYGAGATAYPYVDQVVYDSGVVEKSALTVSDSTVTFQATEELLNGHNWKLQLSNRADETILLDIDIYEEPPVDPTVTVTTQATVAGETAVMTVTWGAGAKKMTGVGDMKYTNASGGAATIRASSLTVNDDTISLTFTTTTIKGTNFILVLKNNSGDTMEFPVDLIEVESDPTVTVTSAAHAFGEDGVMTVDWGGGSKKMTSVKEVKYTDASGNAATIPETAISVSGNTVSVTFDETTAMGHDFILVLTNASGATFEAAVRLVKLDVMNPIVEVTTKVTASAQTAYMTVTSWGTMTSLVRATYTKSSGATGTISVGNYLKISGNTVSLKFTSTTIAGSNFALIFKNSEGVESDPIPVELISDSQESEEPVVTPAIDPVVGVTQKASASSPTALIEVNWGSGSKAMDDVQEVKYTNASGSAATITGAAISVNGNTISVTFDETSLEGRDFILVLKNASGGSFEAAVDLVKPNIIEPVVTVTTQVTASAQTAYMTIEDWGSMTSVNNMTYTKSSGVTGTISIGNYLKVSGNTVSLKFTSTTIQGSNFKLVLKNDNGYTFEAPVDLITGSEPTPTPEPEAPSVNPTVTVTGKATASGDTATITVDWGQGSKAMNAVKEVKYTNASGSAATITGAAISVNGNTVSVTFDATSIAGSGFILVLKNDSGATFEASVDLVKPSFSSPTVEVTTTVTASAQTAYMTITDWGSMTSLSHMTYTKSTGAEGTISIGNYLKISGNTVSLKFTSTTIKGSNFKLVFKDANGETVSVPVELIQIESEPEIDNTPAVDPTVSVTKKATAAGETATITVNWGSGSKQMTKAKEVKYTSASGQSASITGTSFIQTSGTTVSVKFDATSIMGSNFILVLTNNSGATFETPVDLAMSPIVSPTVKVTTKVTSATETAYVTIQDWGTMTSVSHMTYKQASGTTATISIGNYLKVSGNTVSLKFTSTIFKGSDFKLVFKNSNGDKVEVPVELIQT